MKNLEIVSDLSNVRINYNYVTTNHKILKEKEGNRAGLENKRVKQILKLIDTDKFDPVLGIVRAQKDGYIVDGTHTVAALEIRNRPVVFMVVEDKDLNETAEYNSGINTKWDSEAQFGSALTGASPIAVSLNQLRDLLVQKHKMEIKKISASEMYGILVKNTKHFGSGQQSPTRRMWFNMDLMKKVKSREFKKNMSCYAQMKSDLRHLRDAYKICKGVMDLHFDEKIDFNVEVFSENLSFEGFALKVYNMENIKAKAIAMYKKQVKLAA